MASVEETELADISPGASSGLQPLGRQRPVSTPLLEIVEILCRAQVAQFKTDYQLQQGLIDLSDAINSLTATTVVESSSQVVDWLVHRLGELSTGEALPSGSVEEEAVKCVIFVLGYLVRNCVSVRSSVNNTFVLKQLVEFAIDMELWQRHRHLMQTDSSQELIDARLLIRNTHLVRALRDWFDLFAPEIPLLKDAYLTLHQSGAIFECERIRQKKPSSRAAIDTPLASASKSHSHRSKHKHKHSRDSGTVPDSVSDTGIASDSKKRAEVKKGDGKGKDSKGQSPMAESTSEDKDKSPPSSEELSDEAGDEWLLAYYSSNVNALFDKRTRRIRTGFKRKILLEIRQLLDVYVKPCRHILRFDEYSTLTDPKLHEYLRALQEIQKRLIKVIMECSELEALVELCLLANDAVVGTIHWYNALARGGTMPTVPIQHNWDLSDIRKCILVAAAITTSTPSPSKSLRRAEDSSSPTLEASESEPVIFSVAVEGDRVEEAQSAVERICSISPQPMSDIMLVDTDSDSGKEKSPLRVVLPPLGATPPPVSDEVLESDGRSDGVYEPIEYESEDGIEEDFCREESPISVPVSIPLMEFKVTAGGDTTAELGLATVSEEKSELVVGSGIQVEAVSSTSSIVEELYGDSLFATLGVSPRGSESHSLEAKAEDTLASKDSIIDIAL